MIDRYRQSALTGRRKPVNDWRRSLVALLRSSSQRWVAWRCKMSHYRTYRCDSYGYGTGRNTANNITILILIYHTRIDNVVSGNACDRCIGKTKSVICINYCDDKYRALSEKMNASKWYVSGISPLKCDSVSEIMGAIISRAHYRQIAWFPYKRLVKRFCDTNNFIAWNARGVIRQITTNEI